MCFIFSIFGTNLHEDDFKKIDVGFFSFSL